MTSQPSTDEAPRPRASGSVVNTSHIRAAKRDQAPNGLPPVPKKPVLHRRWRDHGARIPTPGEWQGVFVPGGILGALFDGRCAHTAPGSVVLEPRYAIALVALGWAREIAPGRFEPTQAFRDVA